MALLCVFKGGSVGTIFPIVGKQTVIGRSKKADATIDDRGASRQHAVISADGHGRLSIEDLGSNNGTAVNGSTINGNHPLAIGDRIDLGTSSLMVVTNEAPRLLLTGGANGAIALADGSWIIGRDRNACDIHLSDNSISGVHLRLDVNDGDITIEDLGSANGTLLDGQRINGSQRLAGGSSFTIGTFSFTLKRIDSVPLESAETAPLGDGPDDAPTTAAGTTTASDISSDANNAANALSRYHDIEDVEAHGPLRLATARSAHGNQALRLAIIDRE
ncbi:MAG: FHA domain-containing protein, partial [Planctomycetota bacterium]